MSRLLILGASSFLLAGCALRTPTPAVTCPCPAPNNAWTEALSQADSLALAGQHAAADSVLAAFAERHADSHAAREITFWRAFYWLDPQNENGRRSDALAALDDYLQSDSVWWYRTEARVLRRLAAVPTPPAGVAPPRDPGDMSAAEKDREIRQLRDRVARLNDELERIRRRLAAPNP